MPVTITSGQTASMGSGFYKVPKRDLIVGLEVVADCGGAGVREEAGGEARGRNRWRRAGGAASRVVGRRRHIISLQMCLLLSWLSYHFCILRTSNMRRGGRGARRPGFRGGSGLLDLSEGLSCGVAGEKRWWRRRKRAERTTDEHGAALPQALSYQPSPLSCLRRWLATGRTAQNRRGLRRF
jgi:hypothetical protein